MPPSMVVTTTTFQRFTRLCDRTQRKAQNYTKLSDFVDLNHKKNRIGTAVIQPDAFLHRFPDHRRKSNCCGKVISGNPENLSQNFQKSRTAY